MPGNVVNTGDDAISGVRFCLAFVAVLAGADLALNHGAATRAAEAVVPAIVAALASSWQDRS